MPRRYAFRTVAGKGFVDRVEITAGIDRAGIERDGQAIVRLFSIYSAGPRCRLRTLNEQIFGPPGPAHLPRSPGGTCDARHTPMNQDFGLSVDARGLIQQLKNNLVDRYPRDSILKELLQNADDARANWLELGWSAGFAGAGHPLLRGPGLFAVNDGPFRPEDAQAIRSFGLNHKAADRSTIGKFGLGLKSVFHLCEAFFFASSSAPGGGGIVNPWAGTGFHDEWNQFSGPDRGLVLRHLAELLGDGPWFLLWLPLRRAEHCLLDLPVEADDPDRAEPGASELALHSDHPGDSAECPPDVFRDQTSFFADQLPLLRHLLRVRFWDRWMEAGTVPYFEVRLPPDAPRCRFPDPSVGADDRPGTGRVTVAAGGPPGELPYCIRQQWVTALEEFRKRPGWPTSMSFASHRPRPDKALPHAAVSLSRWAAGDEGSLTVSRAVFLPLRGDEEILPLDRGACYSLKLHGCFFVDAGRGQPVQHRGDRPDVSPSPEELLKAGWNDRLLREGVCPLVLPVLEEFVRATGIDDWEILALTRALTDSALVREYGAEFTRAHQWLYRWRPDEPGWRRLSAAASYLEIPDFGSDGPALVATVLPGLARVAATTTLTPRGSPRLAPEKANHWPDGLLFQALDPQNVDFSSWGNRHWAYLRDFLECALPAVPGTETLAALAVLLRALFGTTPNHLLRRHREAVRQVVRRLPPGLRLALPIPETWSVAERRCVTERPVALAIIPREFDPPEVPSTGRLTAADAVGLLTLLQPACADRCTSEPAVAVVAATTDPDALRVQAGFAELRLWVTGYLRPREPAGVTVFTHGELAARLRDGWLFRAAGADGRPPTELALLAGALDLVELCVIPPGTADAAFGPDLVPPPSTPALVRTLAGFPPLSPDPAHRVGIMRHLLAGERPPAIAVAWRTAVRYLLHGRPREAEGDTPLLAGDPGAAGVWGRIARLHLDRTDGGWQVLPAEPLVGLLNPIQRAEAGIVALDKDGVAELVGINGTGQLEIELGDRDRDAVLRGWHDRPDLLRAMPLHDGVHGGRHRINGLCFWQGRYVLEGELARQVTLLRLCKDSQLAAIQGQLADELRPADIITLALDRNPADHWTEILGALADAGTLTRELRERLVGVEWVPADGRSPVPPRRVLLDADPGLDREIGRVLATANNGWVGSTQLPRSVRDHRGFEALRRLCCPTREGLLGSLASALAAGKTCYRTGLRLDDAEEISDWVTAFVTAPPEVAAGRDLLARVWQIEHTACRERFLPALMPGPGETDLTAEKARQVLAFLREQYGPATTYTRRVLARVHNRYLAVAATLPEWETEILPTLLLLNGLGEWRPVAELCVATGLVPAATLDEIQAGLLCGKVAWQEPRRIARSAGESVATVLQRIDAEWHRAAALLDRYFTPWATESEEYAAWAGALLSLLGDFEPVARLAARFLPQGHSADAVRAAARLTPRELADVNGRRHTDSPAQMMRIQRVLVEVTEFEPTVQVVNLVGKPIRVPPAFDGADLFIRYGIRLENVFLDDNLQVHWLNLRQVDLTGAEPRAVRQWVEATASRILQEVYGQANGSIATALPGLTDRDHEVRAAQAVALNAQHTLRQLGHLADPSLRAVLAAFDRAADRKAEEHVAAERGQDLGGQPAEELERTARETLRRLIHSSEAVRRELLGGLRRKVGEYRYRSHAVIFELFQNADDAAVEAGGDAPGLFALRVGAESLTVMHQGRPVNRPGIRMDRETAARDLRKMLALGHSDKGHEGGGPAVTGRFGLGFKSVFLLSDRPELLSGQLGVEVMGGLYPKSLDRTAADGLRAALRDAGLSDAQGTACRLALREGMSATEAVAPYTHLAAYLAVFARKIRRCLLCDDRGTAVEASWNELWRDGTGTVIAGALIPFPGGESLTPRRAITVHAGDATLLLALDSHGVSRVPETVPTVWVTAPTEERLDLGYVVNGPFVLDVGRSQVDWNSSENGALFARLGPAFGEGLIRLFEATGGGWPGIAHLLGVSGDDPYSFWESAWAALTGEGTAPPLLHEMMWGADGCMVRLLGGRSALPSGIPLERHRTLTRMGNVEAMLADELDADGGAILRQVAEWPAFLNLAPGRIVSARVWERLREYGGEWVPEVPAIDLAALLARELDASPQFDPARASLLGVVVTRERTALRELLRSRALFLSGEGRWTTAGDLLLSGGRGDADEAMRAAFAPPDRLLADEYPEQAVEFFLACREHMVARFDQLVEWAITAETPDRRQAVLHYFRGGEQRSRFQEELRRRGIQGCWLGRLDRAQLATAGFDERQQTVTLVATGAAPPDGGQPVPQFVGFAPHRPIPGGLQRIADWWRRGAAEHTRRHDERGVPSGLTVRAIVAAGDDTSVEGRLAWLRLFVGGILSTIGRVTPEQNRAFIALCEDRGWFQTLLDPACGSAGWLREVEDYLDEHAEHIRYFHWLKQFLGIAFTARHVDAFAVAFRSVDQMRGDWTMREVLAVRTSHQFAGSGLDAPPIVPVLGIGACAVLRELRRGGVVRSARADRYCFPPVRRVRELLARLGWGGGTGYDDRPWEQSRSIHEFLADHLADPAFGGGFDLPLLALADDEALRHQVLGG